MMFQLHCQMMIDGPLAAASAAKPSIKLWSLAWCRVSFAQGTCSWNTARSSASFPETEWEDREPDAALPHQQQWLICETRTAEPQHVETRPSGPSSTGHRRLMLEPRMFTLTFLLYCHKWSQWRQQHPEDLGNSFTQAQMHPGRYFP